jgi:hypothetical protein
MTPRRRCRLAVFVVAAMSAFGVGAKTPETKQGRAQSKAEVAVLDAAVLELKKEFAAHQKDPQKSPIRTQCTYFLDHPAQVSPESLLGAIDQVTGNDPRLVAYVRWQMLSAAPKKFEQGSSLLPRVLEAYRKAPLPPPRFGISPQDQAKLDASLKDVRKEDDAKLSTMLEELARREAEANKPILAYRDELYARLPACYDALLAGFRDAAERTAAAAGGGTSDEHAGRVLKDAQAWAQSGTADPKQCAQLAEAVARLRHTRSPPYYARATLRRGDSRLSWATKTDAVYSPKKLSDLEVVLREAQKAGEASKAVNAAAAGPKKK